MNWIRTQIGKWLSEYDDMGHTRLCRFVEWIAHHGCGGTFVHLRSVKLEAGGHLCLYGMECGEPTESKMRQFHENAEQMARFTKLLEKSGAFIFISEENPRFNVENLCNCGKQEEPALPLHHPLCRYREELDFPPTIEEYRNAALINRIH